MGKIQVGQKRPKTVDTGGFTIAPKETTVTNNGVSAEEKAKLVEEIMRLPQEQIVPELRKRGFNDIADITEVQMKQEREKAENLAASRANRLAEIKSLPEEEQLPLLLEEGFEDEAKALSEKLASLNAEGQGEDGEGNDNADGNGEDSSADGESSDGDNTDDAAGDQKEENPKKTSEKKTSAKKGTTKKN